ncbi:MAG: Asp-tRNA(Asn)/Glu-tRNA(Gln) amidotransferase GatCAB subunit B [Desulfobacterales bacterium]|nr:MAG: Asp-tRNA(Asn)/Glu-tRNA(Gln) amidotransferase GatCAB subunit B [Desulfobacterales bacterium]
MRYTSVIGLEVHAQMKTHTKIFCSCATAFGAEPNRHTCPVCTGMPGALPVLNRKVVAYGIKLALATGCAINPVSRFARKNYFYPDLPKNYQVSQYELPLCEHGYLDIQVAENQKRIGITRIHMEEDAGKLIHDPREPVSRVDYNRTGTPLLEIVSEPDMRSPEEAGAYLRKLHSIVRYLDICDGNMEEGSFRCDANVSIMPEGAEQFGTRTEVKNLNSFKHVEKAIAYEIMRQREVIEDGREVVQETRLYDPNSGVTRSMRGKEEAHDYRYFPDPDLLPVEISTDWIEEVRSSLPELPDARKARYILGHGLSSYDAEVLTAGPEIAEFFEECLSHSADAKQAANWIMGPLLGLLHQKGLEISASPVSPEDLAGLLALLEKGVISGKIAKTVFEDMASTGKTAEAIVDEKGLKQVSDTGSIEPVIDRIIAANPSQVKEFRNGKTRLMGFFVGQVMKETRGKANPQVVNQLLKDKLGQ